MCKFKEILDPIANLLEQKNQNYGNSYAEIREKRGNISFLIRLEDKLNRLDQIVQSKNTDLGDENYEDTVKDIIGYCTLELKYLQEREKSCQMQQN